MREASHYFLQRYRIWSNKPLCPGFNAGECTDMNSCIMSDAELAVDLQAPGGVAKCICMICHLAYYHASSYLHCAAFAAIPTLFHTELLEKYYYTYKTHSLH